MSMSNPTDGSKNIGQIKGKLANQIISHLNGSNRWQNFCKFLKGNYEISDSKIQILAKSDNPTNELFLFLGTRNMKINEFVSYARLAKEFKIVEILNIQAAPEFDLQPLEELSVFETDSIRLRVKAVGVPTPQYQWYKNGSKLPNESQEELFVESASQSHDGDYACLAYNQINGELNVKLSNISIVRVLLSPPIEIIEHPSHYNADEGKHVIFKCEVWADVGMTFRWLKDDIPLEDDVNTKGSTTNELRLYNVNAEVSEGCYHCRISRGSSEASTSGAFLQINKTNSFKYTAVDKVALLIGAYDYRSDEQLSAPKYDVQTLAEIFTGMDFKVVSFLNLTKAEMTAAVHEFCCLIGKGVYCVFYFCGHGFETDGQCYLVPPDAPQGYDDRHSISADIIFSKMLQNNPKLCCMILDICRKRKDIQSKPGLLTQRTAEGNSLVCYGTSHGLASFENKQYGILVSHLKTVLGKSIDVEEVFKRLRESIYTDPKLNRCDEKREYKQIPEICTNLTEPGRSFTDPINFNGDTEKFEQRQRIWENAHWKPQQMVFTVLVGDFNVKVKLEFQQRFSNVLKIYTSVLDPGPTAYCVAFISCIPADVQG